ncbi:hypothetical protein ACTXT7_007239 [Hymenolepis weldensis]
MATPELQSTVETSKTEEFGPVSCGKKFRKGLKDNLFTILTLIGVAGGFGIGFGVGTLNPSQEAITWIIGRDYD